jgi:hypothetical protein
VPKSSFNHAQILRIVHKNLFWVKKSQRKSLSKQEKLFTVKKLLRKSFSRSKNSIEKTVYCQTILILIMVDVFPSLKEK